MLLRFPRRPFPRRSLRLRGTAVGVRLGRTPLAGEHVRCSEVRLGRLFVARGRALVCGQSVAVGLLGVPLGPVELAGAVLGGGGGGQKRERGPTSSRAQTLFPSAWGVTPQRRHRLSTTMRP